MVDRSHPQDDEAERSDLAASFPQPGDLVTCGCASMRIWEVVAVCRESARTARVWLTAPDRYPPEDQIVPLYRVRPHEDPTS
jgi:hypothetical protein